MFQKFLRNFREMPKEVRIFLWRSAAIFIAWKLLYITVLIPHQIPDAFLVKQLGNGTAVTLNFFYGDKQFQAVHTTRPVVYGRDTVQATYTMVVKGSVKRVLGIYQACDGLELMILYAGFILCFSGGWLRKLLYIIAGIIGLYIINVLRCVMLSYIGMEYPQHFDFAHKYLFNLIVYLFTFLLWVFYVSGLRLNYGKSKSAP